MINRLVPASIGLKFCANDKLAPGEISRVKKNENDTTENLVRSPKKDTFTANANDSKSNQSVAELPHNKINFKRIFEKKGNA